ncbi:twin-arginine translocase TatA/TatE family subunit [Candidatus Saccharibacteria bacterium]|nr:twin-arginine translocase TatA/TatE family subunit [Candidatus Saccharibacteria bacterium]
MLRNLGTVEIILIASVLLLMIGPKKLPELSRGIGQSIKEIKKGFSDPKKREASTS